MRRIATHKKRTLDGDILTIVTIYEENVNKETVKKLSPFSKTHQYMVKREDIYEFVEK
jgi:hypothetical protein